MLYELGNSYNRDGLVLTKSSSPAGRGNDHAMMFSNVSTLQNDKINGTTYVDINDQTYAVPDQLTADGDIYEELPSEDVTVRTPAATASTGDERYSKLQRDSLVFTQSTATTISGDENVEDYYESLDKSEQYTVSSTKCIQCIVVYRLVAGCSFQ